MNNSEEQVTIGKFTKAFGVHGLIKFVSYSGESAHLKKIKSIYVSNLKKTFEVEAWHTSGLVLKCKIKGIDNPELCAPLLGHDVWVAKKFAAALKEDEYYISDLIGMQVVCEGKSLGSISDIITDAYVPLIEIIWNSNKKGFIPFISEFFSEPNMKENNIALLNEALIENV